MTPKWSGKEVLIFEIRPDPACPNSTKFVASGAFGMDNRECRPELYLPDFLFHGLERPERLCVTLESTKDQQKPMAKTPSEVEEEALRALLQG